MAVALLSADHDPFLWEKSMELLQTVADECGGLHDAGIDRLLEILDAVAGQQVDPASKPQVAGSALTQLTVSTLRALALDERNAVRIARAGAISALVKLLKHPNDAVRSMAAGCLASLSHFGSIATQALDHGALPCLLAMIDPRMDDTSKVVATGALFEFALHKDARWRMVKGKAVRPLVRLLRHRTHDRSTWSRNSRNRNDSRGSSRPGTSAGHEPGAPNLLRVKLEEKAVGTLRALCDEVQFREGLGANKQVVDAFLGVAAGEAVTTDFSLRCASTGLTVLVPHMSRSSMDKCAKQLVGWLSPDRPWIQRACAAQLVPWLLPQEPNVETFVHAGGVRRLWLMLHAKHPDLQENTLGALLHTCISPLAAECLVWLHDLRDEDKEDEDTPEGGREAGDSDIAGRSPREDAPGEEDGEDIVDFLNKMVQTNSGVAEGIQQLALLLLRALLVYHREFVEARLTVGLLDVVMHPPREFDELLGIMIDRFKQYYLFPLPKVASKFDREEMDLHMKDFKACDPTARGLIGADQVMSLIEKADAAFCDAARHQHPPPKPMDAERKGMFMAQADLNGDGWMDFEEMLVMMDEIAAWRAEERAAVATRSRRAKGNVNRAVRYMLGKPNGFEQWEKEMSEQAVAKLTVLKYKRKLEAQLAEERHYDEGSEELSAIAHKAELHTGAGLVLPTLQLPP